MLSPVPVPILLKGKEGVTKKNFPERMDVVIAEGINDPLYAVAAAFQLAFGFFYLHPLNILDRRVARSHFKTADKATLAQTNFFSQFFYREPAIVVFFNDFLCFMDSVIVMLSLR